MEDVKQRGNLTELQCITAFYELGYKVSIPYGENSRYDFIADIDGILIRVQVKTSKANNDEGSFSFPCRSTRVNSNGCYHRLYTDREIDYFCTYFNGQCYLVPVNECSKVKNIRYAPPKNHQQGRINYAQDYELSTQVQRLIAKG